VHTQLIRRHVLAGLAFVLLATSAASAQVADGGPDPDLVRVRVGPLWINPTISLPNIGIDTNVFNDPTTVTPRRDFTITATPKAELWLRLGRSWLSGVVTEEIVWYQKYVSERSANSSYSLGWKAPLNRLVLSAGATWLKTRARPGFEIDVRAERTEPTYSAAAEIRGLSKTFLGVRGNWSNVSFDAASMFQGRSLKEELDRKATSAAVTLRHELTPLTSVTFSVGRSDQRFEFSPSRDSTSDNYSVLFSFDPDALLKGSASFGYTDYKPAATDLPRYQGGTFEVDLAYTLLGSTRFSGNLRRAVELSYSASQPYYVVTGGGVSIAQQIFGPVDVVGRAGSQRLAYRTRVGATVAAPDRTDRVRTYGGGLGFRLGRELRLGFNIDKERRTSVLTDREYRGLKYGTSITYGL
jgi:hypothetical protein